MWPVARWRGGQVAGRADDGWSDGRVAGWPGGRNIFCCTPCLKNKGDRLLFSYTGPSLFVLEIRILLIRIPTKCQHDTIIIPTGYGQNTSRV